MKTKKWKRKKSSPRIRGETTPEQETGGERIGTSKICGGTEHVLINVYGMEEPPGEGDARACQDFLLAALIAHEGERLSHSFRFRVEGGFLLYTPAQALQRQRNRLKAYEVNVAMQKVIRDLEQDQWSDAMKKRVDTWINKTEETVEETKTSIKKNKDL